MLVIFLILAIFFLVKWRKAAKQTQATKDLLTQALERSASLDEQVSRLSKYQGIIDIDAEIQQKKTVAEQELESTKNEAKDILKKAKERSEASAQEAGNRITAANAQAKQIVEDAEAHAKEIAGEAYEIAGKVKDLEKTAIALKNTIQGYGSQYLKPTYSLLDDLAADFGYTEAGQQLKFARETSAQMVKNGQASTCEYVEEIRKKTATAFVVDAFNGKVDSILSKVKSDNYGTLEQKIKDAYELVNYNGRAFRNAAILPEYLNARLEELKWGVRVQELKAQAQEEQRRIREQMREEERARREYEKAMKEAAKEEEMLRKAMEKAQKQIESATEANRAEYEAKLEELKQKLAEAEDRGQRAISMAQQTRRGNVYVISNIGSFGENVYKVGMTRRLDPLDRVRELGDASVPFPFDVHAIIESDDAPALETELHRNLSLMQMNKVNPRKEFFRVSLSDVKAMVENMGLKTAWTLDAAAAEYRETLAIEESMKTDPEAKRRWEEYAAAITNNAVGQDEDELA